MVERVPGGTRSNIEAFVPRGPAWERDGAPAPTGARAVCGDATLLIRRLGGQLGEITARSHEAEFLVRGRDGRSNRVKGLEANYTVKFSGSAKAFTFMPSARSAVHPHGAVEGSDLVLTFKALPEDSAASVKNAFEAELNEIRRWLAWIADDVNPFNDGLRPGFLDAVEARRAQLKRNRKFAQGLGYPPPKQK